MTQLVTAREIADVPRRESGQIVLRAPPLSF